MHFAVTLLEEHIRQKSGGPFAALLVSKKSRKLLSVGLNQVIPLSDPTAHAECSAFRLAAQQQKKFQFNGDAILVATSQMCGMCLTASVWAGVGRIVIGASAQDSKRIGHFDEGVIAANWKSQLQKRGISVETGIMRAEVCAAMREYIRAGGPVYNGRRSRA